MKTIKRRMETFSYYDRTGIRQHLERMAAAGWILDSIGKWTWQYRRIEPKALHFSVNYFPSASQFDPEPSERQQLFEEFCASAGWKLVASSGQMQIFCNETESPLPIETDALLEFETIHKAMKKSYLPGNAAMLILAFLQLALLVWQFRQNPVYHLSSLNHGLQWILYSLLAVLCFYEIRMYFRWYRKAKQLAEETGEALPTRSNHIFQWVGIGLAILSLVVLYLLSAVSDRKTLFLSFAFMGGTFLLTNIVHHILKQRKVSAGINRTVTFISAFVFSFALIGILTAAILNLPGDALSKHIVAETYEFNGREREVYADPIPLRVEDLTEVSYTGYSTEKEIRCGALLTQTDYHQRTRYGEYENWPELDYTIYDTGIAWVYELCLNTRLEQFDRWNTPDVPQEFWEMYRTQDASLWQAEAVYVRFMGSEPYLHDYIICWESRIVELDLWEEPTERQIATIVEKLKPI